MCGSFAKSVGPDENFDGADRDNGTDGTRRGDVWEDILYKAFSKDLIVRTIGGRRPPPTPPKEGRASRDTGSLRLLS